jgi:Protein phosphatase 2C
MTTMQTRAGSIIGRDHILRAANCQDAMSLLTFNFDGKAAAVGVVCDGCGEGTHSEVGATLAASFLAEQGAALLATGRTLEEIPGELFKRLRMFLENILNVRAPLNATLFVRDHLLFTVLGVVAVEETAVVFAAGDGTILIDAAVTVRDEDNSPNYIGYHLIDPKFLTDDARLESFDIHHVKDWARLAIATDGFDADLLPEIWDLPNSRALQRKMNIYSDQARRFRDDATIITFERMREKADERTD